MPLTLASSRSYLVQKQSCCGCNLHLRSLVHPLQPIPAALKKWLLHHSNHHPSTHSSREKSEMRNRQKGGYLGGNFGYVQALELPRFQAGHRFYSVRVAMGTAQRWPKAPACHPTCRHSAGATYRDGVFLALLFPW